MRRPPPLIVVCLLLMSPGESSFAQDSHRLLFARPVDNRCQIGLWEIPSFRITPLTTASKCPEDLYVSTDRETVYVIDGDALRIVTIAAPDDDRAIALPDRDYLSWVESMEPRPDTNPDYLPNSALAPLLAGELDDGAIGIVATLWMPGDDTFQYLFRHDGDGWSIINGRWCNRFGCETPFGGLVSDSTVAWAWPEDARIWHPEVSTNPIVRERVIESSNPAEDQWESTIHTLQLDVEGTQSTLRFDVNPSEHFDISYVFGIELSVDGAPPINLSSNQCLTWLVGRYLMVYEFFKGRFEITDVATGETLIDGLATAMWID